MKIYVIQGSTGEYSDHMEWPVCAFKDEQKAKDFVVQLTKEAQELFAASKHYLEYEYYDSAEVGLPPNDPDFNCYYGRFNYVYFEAELKDD